MCHVQQSVLVVGAVCNTCTPVTCGGLILYSRRWTHKRTCGEMFINVNIDTKTRSTATDNILLIYTLSSHRGITYSLFSHPLQQRSGTEPEATCACLRWKESEAGQRGGERVDITKNTRKNNNREKALLVPTGPGSSAVSTNSHLCSYLV